MINKIEALNFRSLRNISQGLGPFQVLVGPNASGKTTFLDVIAFLGRIVSEGLEAAVEDRTTTPQDLTWRRSGGAFQLAIEASLPADIRSALAERKYDTIRYEVSIETTPELGFGAETVLLFQATPPTWSQLDVFPSDAPERASLLTPKQEGRRKIVNKVQGGNDNFYPETTSEAGKGGWVTPFRLGPRKSALANLPEDESKFPATTWLKRLLSEGVQSFVLNSVAMRRASPPGKGRGFKPDGSNLPWVIAALEHGSAEDKSRLAEWVKHLRTALPDLSGVRTVERADDKHRYLMLSYENGIEVPSWMASDGTLRLLALTLPAYLPDFRGVFLIEEPENGIHPRAAEAALQSLSSAYDAQILVASHSPVVLSLVEPKDVLCFGKTVSGATAIVRGSEHPALKSWRGETSLGTLFASGVLS
ncbi:MAG: AAA family ATPase [Myxococcales bacterium]|nr:AAA family ATPase [Myxococcales bacterium]